MSAYSHRSVLTTEVIEHLQLKKNDNVVDATVGGGGHADAILQQTGPDGKLLGCDLDPRAVAAAKKKLAHYGDRVKVVQSSYVHLKELLRAHDLSPIDAIVADLGLSSDQLENSRRGFSFNDIGEIDMRFNPDEGISASELIASASKEDLTALLKQYSDITAPGRLAQALINMRDTKKGEPITVPDVVRVVQRHASTRSRKHHPATQIFQALRIAVNHEMENVKSFLPQALDSVRIGGRIAIISFHSIEDRIVKQFFREQARDCICPPEAPKCICDKQSRVRIITTKPVRPSDKELQENPRSRSAILRVAERLV